MRLDKTFWKRLALLVGGAIVLAFLLSNIEMVGTVVASIWGILFPFVLGFILAFLLNLPMSGIERLIFRGKGGRARRPVSFILSLLAVLLVLGFTIFLLVPQLVRTVGDLAARMPGYLAQAEKAIQPYLDYLPVVEEWLDNLNLDWKEIVSQVTGMLQSGAGNFVSSAVDVATGIVGGFFSFFIGIIFSVYLLLDKEHLIAQLKGLLKAYLPEKRYNKLTELGGLVYHNYASFVAGQCTEALVLTVLYSVVLGIGGFEYPLLIGVVIGLTSLIPMFGAYIGCAVGVFLLAVSMGFWRALAFVIIMIVIQQLDGNLIYPHIVGSTMGLPAIWTLVAVMVGGGLGGLFGMLFFIPLFSVIYTLLGRNSRARLLKKGITPPVDELPRHKVRKRRWPWQKKKQTAGNASGGGTVPPAQDGENPPPEDRA